MQQANHFRLKGIAMNLHGKCINIPCLIGGSDTTIWGNDAYLAYKNGHRDARHAAAQLALQADSAMEEAAQVIKELCIAYGHPMPGATLARLLGCAAGKPE
jgi:hypothetical protein